MTKFKLVNTQMKTEIKLPTKRRIRIISKSKIQRQNSQEKYLLQLIRGKPLKDIYTLHMREPAEEAGTQPAPRGLATKKTEKASSETNHGHRHINLT